MKQDFLNFKEQVTAIEENLKSLLKSKLDENIIEDLMK